MQLPRYSTPCLWHGVGLLLCLRTISSTTTATRMLFWFVWPTVPPVYLLGLQYSPSWDIWHTCPRDLSRRLWTQVGWSLCCRYWDLLWPRHGNNLLPLTSRIWSGICSLPRGSRRVTSFSSMVLLVFLHAPALGPWLSVCHHRWVGFEIIHGFSNDYYLSELCCLCSKPTLLPLQKHLQPPYKIYIL